jgi:hypothetical protein
MYSLLYKDPVQIAIVGGSGGTRIRIAPFEACLRARQVVSQLTHEPILLKLERRAGNDPALFHIGSVVHSHSANDAKIWSEQGELNPRIILGKDAPNH